MQNHVSSFWILNTCFLIHNRSRCKLNLLSRMFFKTFKICMRSGINSMKLLSDGHWLKNKDKKLRTKL